MKSIILSLCIVMLGTFSLALIAAEQKQASTLAKVGMKAKLTAAKEMLGALANKDFAKIKSVAESMQGLNLIEYLSRSNSPHYRSHLTAFQLATTEMVLAAKQKNVEGATLAYTQMAVSCVNCHKHLKNR